MDYLNQMGPSGINPFIQSILNGGATIGQTPQFTKKNAGLKLDDKKRLKVDPMTGEPIKPKDRVKWKKIRRNPYGITPGNSLNMNVPNILSGQNMGEGMDLGAILGQATRLGGQ
tara:strand:+ start:2083 stop:2424 length:342 start_codon:yes stop_codon:yes gene_type:complete